MARYQHVKFEDRPLEGGGLYPQITLYSIVNGEGAYHSIPAEAVANRMELFGLADEIEGLEFIGRSSADPQYSDRLHQIVAPVYAQVVQVEVERLLDTAGNAPREERGIARTMVSCGAASKRLCGELDAARAQCRNLFELAERDISQLRVQPVRNSSADCCMRCAKALDTEVGNIGQIMAYVDTMPEMIPAFRMLTASTYAPRLAGAMAGFYERKGR